MNVQAQIIDFINSQPEAKRTELLELHKLTLLVQPECTLSFFDGKDSDNRTVSNPTIGYGTHTLHYAGGKTRETFQVGISTNTTGISVYILGISDKTYLTRTFGSVIGKASITGYCIKFRTLKNINIPILEAALRYGFQAR